MYLGDEGVLEERRSHQEKGSPTGTLSLALILLSIPNLSCEVVMLQAD